MGASTHKHLHLENFNFPGHGYRTSEPTLKLLVFNQSVYWQRTHHLQHPCSVGDCRHYILLLNQRNRSCCTTWLHYCHHESAASIMSNKMNWVSGILKSHISYQVQRGQKLFQLLEQQRTNEIRDVHSCARTSKCNCQHDDPSAQVDWKLQMKENKSWAKWKNLHEHSLSSCRLMTGRCSGILWTCREIGFLSYSRTRLSESVAAQ
jgi:hypothetical protein